MNTLAQVSRPPATRRTAASARPVHEISLSNADRIGDSLVGAVVRRLLMSLTLGARVASRSVPESSLTGVFRHPLPGPSGRPAAARTRCRRPTGRTGAMTDAPRTIRVYLLDDHEVVRQGLRALLESAGDIEIVGESGSAVDATHRIP